MLKLSQFVFRIFVGYTTVSVIVNLQSWNILVESANPTCNTPVCQALGKLYLNSMNTRVNPCTNFYQYACQNWDVNNDQIRKNNYWRTEDLLQKNAFTTLQRLLDDPKKSSVAQFEEAKAFYRACKELPKILTLNRNEVRDIMRQVGHWPMGLPKEANLPFFLNVWQIDNKYLQRSGESALFTVLLTKYNKLNGRIITKVSPLKSPYGKLYRTEDWSAISKERRYYQLFLNKLTSFLLQIPMPLPGYIAKDIEDVLFFRDKLRIVLRKLHKSVEGVATIKEVQDMYNKHLPSNSTKKITWLDMIRHVYVNARDSSGQPILPSTFIQVNPNYVAQLLDLLSKTPKRVIVNHIHLYFAERHTTLSSDMVADLDQSYSFKNGRLDGFQIMLQSRADFCITTHSMDKTIRLMYSKAALTPSAEAEVNKLFSETKQLLKDEILQSSWLEQRTKEASIRKIEYISSVIGPPLSSKSGIPINCPIKIDSLEPSAQFEINSNCFYISASYLQPPMYTASAPFVIDYGTTVAVIGHELQHAFDSQAIYMYGNDTITPWPLWMQQEYVNRAMCFKNQYDKYRSILLAKHGIDKQTVLPYTFDEDIADVTGLKIAFKGYRKMLKQSKNVCQVLPGFEKTPCDKLFFIAFANTFCATPTTAIEKRTLQFDTHSLPSIRVNGAVANMKEFSDAFGCTPTDPLNLKEKCDLWKY